ncbi:MAG: hypothetical protein MZU91_14380 [Desulfosudis oleivorans]|nr:hypothetical protein [Desulfosudis oleivorans]
MFLAAAVCGAFVAAAVVASVVEERRQALEVLRSRLDRGSGPGVAFSPHGAYHPQVGLLDPRRKAEPLPQGAPPADVLNRILGLLFSEREAELVSSSPSSRSPPSRRRGVWKIGAGRGAAGPRRARRPGDPPRRRGRDGEHDLRPAAADGRLLRVLDDADARRHRPEGCSPSSSTSTSTSRRTSSRPSSPTARPSSAGRSSRRPSLPADDALHVLDYERASEVIRTARAPRRRHLLLPAQDGAPRAAPATRRWTICMTFNGAADVADRGTASPARSTSAEGARPPRSRRASSGLVQFGENVQRRRQLHLQLLRLLLRGDDRRAPLRRSCTRSTPPTSCPPSTTRSLHRLRQVRRRLPGRGDGPGLGQRPAAAEARRWRSSTRRSASAAASASRACPTERPRRSRRAPERVITPVDSTHRAVRDGDRAGQAAEPDLRQPRAGEPPGDGGGPRGDPEAAAGQAGDGEPADEVALPREAAVLRGASGRGAGPSVPEGILPVEAGKQPVDVGILRAQQPGFSKK